MILNDKFASWIESIELQFEQVKSWCRWAIRTRVSCRTEIPITATSSTTPSSTCCSKWSCSSNSSSNSSSSNNISIYIIIRTCRPFPNWDSTISAFTVHFSYSSSISCNSIQFKSVKMNCNCISFNFYSISSVSFNLT